MSENSSQARQIKCPQCGRLAFYSADNPFRPFCSERCRLIDLGQWADGKYAIPVQREPDSEDLEQELENEMALQQMPDDTEKPN